MRIIATVGLPNLEMASDSDIAKKVLTSWPVTPWIEARDEIWTFMGQDLKMQPMAYNSAGDYIGDLKFAKYLAGRCIRPELKSPDMTVCSIGYSHTDRLWYGWSHRAMVGFGIGDRIFDERFGNDSTPYVKHGSVEITTMEQARESAIKFADYVS